MTVAAQHPLPCSRRLSSLALLLSFALALVFVARSAPAYGQSPSLSSWQFANASNIEQWEPNAECALITRPGVMIIKSTGRDPYLVADATGPKGWIELTLRSRSKNTSQLQLFWSTVSRGGFTEEQSVKVEAPRSSAMKDHKIYFQADGPLKQLRIDPHSGPIMLQVESIQLAQKTPPPPPTPQATPVDAIKVVDGFQVELLYSVPSQQQGSWVSMTHDDRGRLIVCDQTGSLYRLTLPGVGPRGRDLRELQVEKIDVDLGMAKACSMHSTASM